MTNKITTSPDFIEAGKGQKVILFHSSVAGARQWRSLMDTLADRFHLIAVNLYGYGKTDKWPDNRLQTLEDQATLIEPFFDGNSGKVSIVGHSFGGSVAMKAAALFRDRIHRLVLIEPNPFYLLEQYKQVEAFQEAVKLRDAIKANAENDTWELAAEIFANYWTGNGSWNAMSDERKSKFTQALRPNYHEWDAVMNEDTKLSEWENYLPVDTTVLSAIDTVQSIKAIVSLMKENITDWNFEQVQTGGHMGVMTRPEIFNPIVESALFLSDC